MPLACAVPVAIGTTRLRLKKARRAGFGFTGCAVVSAVATGSTSGSTPSALVHGDRVAFAAVWIFLAIGLAGCLLIKRSLEVRNPESGHIKVVAATSVRRHL